MIKSQENLHINEDIPCSWLKDSIKTVLPKSKIIISAIPIEIPIKKKRQVDSKIYMKMQITKNSQGNLGGGGGGLEGMLYNILKLSVNYKTTVTNQFGTTTRKLIY